MLRVEDDNWGACAFCGGAQAAGRAEMILGDPVDGVCSFCRQERRVWRMPAVHLGKNGFRRDALREAGAA